MKLSTLTSFTLLTLLTLTAAPVALAEDAPPAPALDFTAELLALSAIAGCDGRDFDRERFAAVEVETHCAALAPIIARYRDGWLSQARPFFERLVPADAPRTVVYPFGGADLLTVLAVFPDVVELTTLSLESGGDPRMFSSLDARTLRTSLNLHREYVEKLTRVNHSRTLDLARLKGDPLPSQIVFAVVGLAAHGYEPVGLRYLRVEPDGTLAYLSEADVAAAEATFRGRGGSTLYRKRAALFGSFELRFRRGPDGPEQVYRHLSANLDDRHLGADPRVLRHLEAKGRVTAMTKAASYLLWWRSFSTIRAYLLAHVTWMVSDSTGIPPNHLDPEVFELETYGRFDATAIKGSPEGEAAYRRAWAEQPHRPLPFMFGYPSKAQHAHLVVMRRR